MSAAEKKGPASARRPRRPAQLAKVLQFQAPLDEQGECRAAIAAVLSLTSSSSEEEIEAADTRLQASQRALIDMLLGNDEEREFPYPLAALAMLVRFGERANRAARRIDDLKSRRRSSSLAKVIDLETVRMAMKIERLRRTERRMKGEASK